MLSSLPRYVVTIASMAGALTRRLLAVAAVATAFLAPVSPAQALDVDDADYGRWAEPRVVIYADGPLRHWKLNKAVRYWNQPGVVEIAVSKVPCTGCITVRQIARPYSIPGLDTAWRGVAHLAYDQSGTTTIASCRIDLVAKTGLMRRDRAGITMHEIGHCLGLAHVHDGQRSVLTVAPYGPNSTPSQYDYDNLAALYAA